jgi:hypothetical protein
MQVPFSSCVYLGNETFDTDAAPWSSRDDQFTAQHGGTMTHQFKTQATARAPRRIETPPVIFHVQV